jgi:hypothetical protein
LQVQSLIRPDAAVPLAELLEEDKSWKQQPLKARETQTARRFAGTDMRITLDAKTVSHRNSPFSTTGVKIDNVKEQHLQEFLKKLQPFLVDRGVQNRACWISGSASFLLNGRFILQNTHLP